MKTKLFLIALAFPFIFMTSCGSDSPKDASETIASHEKTSENGNFELTLSNMFYMTGAELDDLYINATLNSGSLQENTEIELVQKANPDQRISANIYRIDDTNFQRKKSATAGEDVILYLKVKNDKGFPLSNTGELYDLVPKGQSVQSTATAATGKATILIDGKEWKYDYYHIYHYTKDYGITKNPANYLITFTKANKNLKNTPEEVLQISLFHAPQEPKSFAKTDIDVAFNSDLFGTETAYSKPFKSELPASASVDTYQLESNKAKISGTCSSDAKAFLCKTCPNIKIQVTFENMEVAIDNN
jgi:hypothetical protein